MTHPQNLQEQPRSSLNHFPTKPIPTSPPTDTIPQFTREIQKKIARSGHYIPETFLTSLLLYLSCAMRPEGVGQARLFIVEGEPGTGKTTSSRMALVAAGFHIVNLDAAMLESPNAGEPAQYTIRKINETSKHIDEQGPAALMADDLDIMGSENTAITTGTRNSSQVIACLQGYCDDPAQLLGQGCSPVPIIATCNDASGFRESFNRGGRALRFHFNPEGHELILMAHAMLQHELTDKQFADVVHRAKGWRIAQYRDLLNRIERANLMSCCKTVSLEKLFDLDSPHPQHANSRGLSQPELDACVEAVQAARVRTNYLA